MPRFVRKKLTLSIRPLTIFSQASGKKEREITFHSQIEEFNQRARGVQSSQRTRVSRDQEPKKKKNNTRKIATKNIVYFYADKSRESASGIMMCIGACASAFLLVRWRE